HADALCFFDTNHEWQQSHLQYDFGKNDGFALTNGGALAGYALDPTDPNGSRAMSYYTAEDLPFYYALAAKFAISDRYFAGLLGPTFPNRLYLYAATSAGMIMNELKPGLPTIFARLSDASITFKLYASDLAGAYITYMPSPDAMVPVTQFAQDAAAGTLPQVSFVDPQFLSEAYSETSEHPPADIQVGQQFVRDQVVALMKSPNWPDSAMFLTYDEHGGLFDHVPPPPACVPDDVPPELDAGAPVDGGADLDAGLDAAAPDAGEGGIAPTPTFDRYGFRVPLFVISPYAKPHFVSHQVHSHTSITRFIEARFGLPALSARDANADALLDLFDFDAPPALLTPPSLPDAPLDPSALAACQLKFPGKTAFGGD
ncbi:MAG TPA: alkaline phosphatase family protein, partial [Polyangiaceae bacterium]